MQIADKVVLTEIMGSREKTLIIYAKDLSDKIPIAFGIIHDEVVDYVAENARRRPSITLGCGDVYKLQKTSKKLKANRR